MRNRSLLLQIQNVLDELEQNEHWFQRFFFLDAADKG